MKGKYFLGITFILSWGVEILLIATGHTEDGIFSSVFPLIAMIPALAVLITKYAVKEPLFMNLWLKPEGRKTFLYSVLGWFAPVLLIVAGSGLYFLIFHNNFDWSMSAEISSLRTSVQGIGEYTDGQIRNTVMVNAIMNIFLAPLYNIFTCVGEEFAWRGYFLQMLCEKYSKWRAVIINGIVWGIWYLPLVVGMGLLYGKNYTGYPVVGCVNALLYFLVLGIIYSFLTIKTHTCLPAILANACVSSMSGVGTLFFRKAENVGVFLNPTPTSILGGAGFLIAAGIILYYMVKGRVEPAPEKNEIIDAAAAKGKRPSGSLKSHTQNKHLRKDR